MNSQESDRLPNDIAIRANTANDQISSARQLEGTIVHRILYGWLNDDEAASYLAQIAKDPNHYQSLIDRHQAMKSNIAQRQQYDASSAELADESGWGLDDVRQQPGIAALIAQDFRIGLVDVNQIIAIQKSVKLTGLDERIQLAATNKASLTELCLPTDITHSPRALVDPDGRAITLSSPNPNFRIMDMRMDEVDYSIAPGSPAIKMHAVSIVVGATQSFVHVTHYNGRYYLKDGYHRSVGLLRANTSAIPCLISEALSLEQLAIGSGGISVDVLLGDHPPTLSDYLDDSVSGEGLMADTLKVVRVSGEEFNVSG